MTKLFGLSHVLVPAANVRVKNRVIWLVGAIVFSICLKLTLLAAGVLPFNSDEAIIALMARHITQGARPVFFYGQAYMGSLDAFLVAGGFRIFGEQIWVIRLIQTILYSFTIWTTAWLGKKAFDSWQIGVSAAWFLAFPTVNVTLYTTVSLGGYGEMLLLGNLILLVTLKIAGDMAEGQLYKIRWLWFLWGLLTGLGLWAFALTLVYSLPAGLYLIHSIWKNARKEARGANSRLSVWNLVVFPSVSISIGVLIGALPWFLYAAKFDFAQLLAELQGGAIAGVEGLPWLQSILQHLVNLFLLGSTAIFGLRPTWEVRWLALPLLPLALFFWIAVLVYMVRKLKVGSPYRVNILLLAGVGFTLIIGFILTPFGADPSGRYFLPLAVLLALFASDMVFKLERRWGRWAFGLTALILAFNLAGTLQSASRFPPGITTQFDAVTQIDHTFDLQLISFLREKGADRGYTNYWVTYPLAFNSREKLIFTPRLPYHQDFRYTPRDDRYGPYNELVSKAGNVAYITTNHPNLDRYLRTSWENMGVTWQEQRIGDYQVFYNLSKPVRPDEIGLGEDLP